MRVINERFYADYFKDDGACSSSSSYIMGRRGDLKLINEDGVELCVIELKKGKNVSSAHEQQSSTGSQQEQQKQIFSRAKLRGEKRRGFGSGG